MSRNKLIEQSFIIDKLTDSILNTVSGDSFQTEVAKMTSVDFKKEVYKLTIINNSSIVQGLLSLTIEQDHVYMNLLESAPFNIGKDKLYEGVAGNLVAFACKISFQKGFDGFVVFTAKTKLIKHYEENIGAYHFKNQLMIIQTESAKKLVNKYFKS